MDPTLRCWLHHELTPQQALAIGEAQARTWPKPGKDAHFRSRMLLEKGQVACARPDLASRSFVLTVGDAGGEEVIAHASLEPRQLLTTAGPIWIMGLAGVCSDPERRGHGLGGKIVRAAFAFVDEGPASFSVFQTSSDVQSFYQRLGSKVVENRIIDSTAEDPNACPFWDDVVLRYPASGDWPTGEIDLQGPGY